MSSFGKGEEIKEGGSRKLYTGAENFKVVGVNPTKEEMEAIYGREINYEPEYVGTTTVKDSDGEREVTQVRIDFYLQSEGEDPINTKASFYVANTHHKSQTQKIKVINDFGKTTWLTEQDIKEGTVPQNMSWYNQSGIKVARRGEEEVIDFIVNLLNLPFDLTKIEDPSEAHAKFSKDDLDKMFKGDTSLLKSIIDGTNNKIGVILGVKTKADGGLQQSLFNRKTMRQYTISSTRANKFQYIAKDIADAKANGAFGNVDFGPADYELREYSVVPTTLDASNTNQTDIFATNEESVDDDFDFLSGN